MSRFSSICYLLVLWRKHNFKEFLQVFYCKIFQFLITVPKVTVRKSVVFNKPNILIHKGEEMGLQFNIINLWLTSFQPEYLQTNKRFKGEYFVLLLLFYSDDNDGPQSKDEKDELL